MTSEVRFFIRRDDGCYYAGAADRKPVWTKRKQQAAAFKAREQAEPRMMNLPPRDNGRYEIVT